MCSVSKSQMEQAIGWIWDDLWIMLDQPIHIVNIEFAVMDLIHLENMWRGKDGYDPSIIGDFLIGI